MAFMYATAGSGTGGSGGTVTIDFTAAELVTEVKSITVNDTIAAGAYKVTIKNVGPSGGGIIATATVNGEPLFTGRELKFNAETDWVTKEVLYLPQYQIITNGATIWYEVTKP